MTPTPKAFLDQYDALDRMLVKAGFPATSPWWRAQLGRLFVPASSVPARRRWLVRAGRRAGKSSTLARLAVAWALFGSWAIPPGDIGVVAFISLSKDEASSRLRTISAILDALGIKYEQRGDELEISVQRRALFKVFACNTSAVVGFTSIAVFGDEVARWESRDTGANPAREVVGSLAPTMATVPAAFMVLSSSPWSVDDYHAELFDLGDTAFQLASFAPTWEANPTITEEQTHELEPDVRVWSREYAAQPSASVCAAFEPELLIPCFTRKAIGAPRDEGWVAIDPSSLRGDGFGYMVGRTTGRDELVIEDCGEFGPTIPLRAMVRRLAMYARSVNTNRIFSDQREEAALRTLFEQHGIELVTFAWGERSKEEAVAIVNRWLHEERLIVNDCKGAPRLRHELLGVKARALPSGRTQYGLKGLDVAACLVTAAHAVDAGNLVVGSGGNTMFDAIGDLLARGEPLVPNEVEIFRMQRRFSGLAGM